MANVVVEKFDDNTLMFFGKHRGKKLANVPAQYLLWWHGTQNGRKPAGTSGRLYEYIVENMDVLQKDEGEREYNSDDEPHDRKYYD